MLHLDILFEMLLKLLVITLVCSIVHYIDYCALTVSCAILLLLKHDLNKKDVPPAHFYYDMEYCVDYSTFRTLHNGKLYCYR